MAPMPDKKARGRVVSPGDAILAGGLPRRTQRRAPPTPGLAVRRLLSRLDAELARVDADKIDREDRVPPVVLARLERLGVLRLNLPRAYGGLGLDRADYHRILARISARSLALAMIVTTHQSLGAAALVAAFGGPEQKAQLLPRMAAGELSALAASEALSGADPALAATTARRVRGGWRLDGRKLWVSNAVDARWLAVLARAPDGPTLFIIDARTRGVSVERRCRFLGLRGLGNGVLRLRGVIISDAGRVGADGDGARLLLALLGEGRLTVLPRALGLTRAVRDAARAWMRTRRRRGRALAQEPAVAARLNRLDALVARLESLDAAAAAWSRGGSVGRTESALAKLYAAAAAWEAADTALQLRGARGYETADSQRARGETAVPAERWLRDARGLRLVEGSDDLLRWAVARRGLELARAGARAPRAAGALGRRAAALAAEFRALGRARGEAVPARALELADEAARILAESL